MKLIDLLVQELPKRGGWPDGANAVTQDSDGYLCFWNYGDPKHNGFEWKHESGEGLCYYYRPDSDVIVSSDSTESIITRDQYESALSASQKPAWNGDGLPPVGCECEFIGNDTSWGIVKIIGYDREGVVFRPNQDAGYYVFTPSEKHVFRPLRTEADKKRDDICMSIYGLIRHRSDIAEAVYDAIAAGKIPGVKLED